MSDFSTEWGVAWSLPESNGTSGVNSRQEAERMTRNMRAAGHAASIVWRGVTEWHHEINDELAMQPVATETEVK